MSRAQLWCSFDILNPTPATLPQAPAGMLDPAQKPQVIFIFQLIIEAVILGCEADQQSGRFPARVMTTSSPSASQKPGEIILE